MVACCGAQLTDNLDEGLAQRADTIAAVLADAPPGELAADEDLLVQVVDCRTATVLAASANLAGVGADRAARSPASAPIDDVPGTERVVPGAGPPGRHAERHRRA